MQSRFECPRCQTVFTHDRGGDAAFVECPSCGALAIPAGDTTDALQRAVSSVHDVPALRASTLDGEPAMASHGEDASGGDFLPPSAEGAHGDNAEGGIFAGLLGQQDARVDLSFQMPSDARRPIEDDVTGPPDNAPTPAASSSAASSSAASSSSSASAHDDTDPPAAARGELDLGLDDELGDFDLPMATRPVTPSLRAMATPAPTRSARTPPSSSSSTRAAEPELRVERAADSFEQRVGIPGPASDAMTTPPLLSISDEAFGALERAFDDVAMRPQAAQRGRDGLTDDERAFLEGRPAPRASAQTGTSTTTMRELEGGAPPPRPPPRRAPAPPPRNKPPPRASRDDDDRSARVERPAPQGLQLSAEARELAFLPLTPVGDLSSSRTVRPPVRARRDEQEARSSRNDAPTNDDASITGEHEGVRSDDVNRARSSGGRRTRNDAGAPTRVEPRVAPTIAGSLRGGAMAVAVVVGLVLGGATGALTAPAQVKQQTPRARAERSLAEGNRYYDQGRFDDALAQYKAATSIDRTYSLAHRAKGAALAKLQRYDEAGDAYREYLNLEPSALDADDARDAIAHRRLPPDGAPSAASGG